MLHTILLWTAGSWAASPATPPLKDELLASFHELTRPAAEGGPDHACLTPLVRQLKDNWDLFSPAERAEITSKLAPWATDLKTAMRPRADVSAPPPPGLSSTPCFTWSGSYEILEDPNGRFYVTWETGAIDEDTAQELLDAMTHGWEKEVDELGWWEPAGTDTYPMLVYVYDDASAAGAYTTVEYCSDSVGYIPYIVIGSGSFYGGTWYEDMAVHEFNHASQWGYTDDAGWVNTNIDLWWWEATATWVQEHVNPDNNWWSQYIWGYTNAPYVSLETSSQSNTTDFWHMYGMAIWAFYLDEHVGGHDLVQDTWEFAATSSDRNIDIEELMEGVDLDFEEVYLGFITNSVVMDFDERRYFGTVEYTEEVDELPASGEPSRHTPEGYGQNFIRIDKDAAEEGTTATVTFNGDNDEEWYALVVQADGKELIAVQQMELNENQKGTADIVFDGDSDFVLVVSPKGDFTSGKDYSWSVEAVEVEPEPEEETETGDSGAVTEEEGEEEEEGGQEGDGAFNTDEEPKGGTCGCASGGASGSLGLGALVGALALARRRRR